VVLPLQEFDVEIQGKKGSENVVVVHLSRMNRGDDKEPIKDKMRDDDLYRVLDQHYSIHTKDVT
jgi:hypothetical protein